jgi:hypothetical protein
MEPHVHHNTDLKGAGSRQTLAAAAARSHVAGGSKEKSLYTGSADSASVRACYRRDQGKPSAAGIQNYAISPGTEDPAMVPSDFAVATNCPKGAQEKLEGASPGKAHACRPFP